MKQNFQIIYIDQATGDKGDTMYLLYGIAAIAICCIIQFASTVILRWSVLDLNLLLFFGVFFASQFVSEKMMMGLNKENKKDTKLRRLVCIASGIVVFIALYYMEFRANDMLQGVTGHASLPTDCTFIDYIVYKMDYVDQEFVTRQGRVGTFPTSGVPNYIIFVLQAACAVFASYIGYIRKKTDYCDDCHKYYKTKELFCATQGDLGQIIKNGEIKIADLKKLESFIDSHKVCKDKKSAKYSGLLLYCPDCGKAKLVIRNKSYNSKKEKEFREKTIEIDKTWTKELAEKNTNKYNFD